MSGSRPIPHSVAPIAGRLTPTVITAIFGFAGAIVVFCAASPSAACVVEGCYGTKDGKVYHNDAACSSGRKIIAENRVTFTSVKDAELQGRRLCKTCERRALSGKNRGVVKTDPPDPQPPEPREEKQGGRGKAAASQPAGGQQPRRAAGEAAKPAIDPARALAVGQVLPGGALLLDDGEKVHLLGVCCPEDRQPLANETIAYIEKLVKARKCVSGWDGEASRAELRNELGQLLVYVAAGPAQVDIGNELVSQGLAWVDRERRCERTADYLEREHLAWAEGRGIWKRISGVGGNARVLAGQYARAYHPVDCPHAVHLCEPSEITVNEALARRLVPCCFYRVGPAAGQKPTEDKTKNAKSRD